MCSSPDARSAPAHIRGGVPALCSLNTYGPRPRRILIVPDGSTVKLLKMATLQVGTLLTGRSARLL